ncbi:hypothetical protein [Xanthobacter autotrophicus]|uniref:hypothetical protein n=1 Tax=Xanthobacter autotrophicus TaxID=280 RepID=UPI0024A64F46|nr:hypothetical protein [Xanthobacter autotrophicus]MDI4655541.1 hypothetical protein [Xanthobacter autotrophicus]
MDNREHGTDQQADAGNPQGGEWLSIPEAIGWILFHDLEEARKCSGKSSSWLSLTYAFAKRGVDGPAPVMSLEKAEAGLLKALQEDRVLAEAERDGGRRSMIPPRVWKLVKFSEAPDPWCARSQDGKTLLRQILVSADMLVKAFAKGSEPSGDGRGVGAPPSEAPTTGDDEVGAEGQSALALRPGKRGRPVVHDWPPFYAEVRRFSAEGGGQLIQADVEKHMGEWCDEKISGSAIREHVKLALAGNKPPVSGK